MSYKVFIRAGHGGKDSGATGNGLNEKDINLRVANCLNEYLKTQPNIEIKMLRTDDTYYSLTNGVNASNNWGANLFISVHHNGGGGDGFEIFHSIHSLNGEKLANCVADEYKKLGQNVHGQAVKVKESDKYKGHDYYTELGNTKAIAIISEFAFIDSKDVEIIDTDIELKVEAKALAKGICEYLNINFIDIDKKEEKSKYNINFCLAFQKWYNQFTNKKLVEDGVCGINTEMALEKISSIIRDFK